MDPEETAISGRNYFFRDIVTSKPFDAWIISSMKLVEFVDVAADLHLIPDLGAENIFLIVRGSLVATNQGKLFCELVPITNSEEVWIVYRQADNPRTDDPESPGKKREKLLSDNDEQIRDVVEKWVTPWNLKVLASQYLISPERIEMLRKKLQL